MTKEGEENPAKTKQKQRKPPIPHARKSPNNSHTSPKVIKREKLKAEAMEYRLQAYSFPRIATALNISTSYAYDLVTEGIAELKREPATALLEMHRERLDLMLSAIFNDAASGDREAIAVALRLEESRRRLEGMDKTNTTVKVSGSGAEGADGPSLKIIIEGGLPDPEQAPEPTAEPPTTEKQQ